VFSLLREPLWTLRRIARWRLPPVIPLSGDILLTRTVRGHRLLLDARDLSLTPQIALDGVWEEGTTRVLLNRLRPGMTYVEVGTNIGYYTTLAATRVGPRGRVIGFEANPRLAELASRSLCLNMAHTWAEVRPQAVADRSGVLTLYTHSHFSGNSSIMPGVLDSQSLALDIDPAAAHRRVDVPAVTLDEALAGQKVDFVKMDIEGAEPLAVRGMSELLRANPRLQMVLEFAPALLRAAGFEPAEVLADLRKAGFTLARILDDGRCAPATDAELLTGVYADLYLARQG
jgi:FkbM family methyltransferase